MRKYKVQLPILLKFLHDCVISKSLEQVKKKWHEDIGTLRTPGAFQTEKEKWKKIPIP